MDVEKEILARVVDFIHGTKVYIEMHTVPRCFHCGRDFVKDKKHCNITHSTWKPDCSCISTTTIRVTTGGDSNTYLCYE